MNIKDPAYVKCGYCGASGYLSNEVHAALVAAVVSKIQARLNKAWSFDENQQHTHSWHDKQDFIEWLRSGAT